MGKWSWPVGRCRARVGVVALVVVVSVACASPAPGGSVQRPSSEAQPTAVVPTGPTRLAMIATRDITNLSPKLGNTGSAESDYGFLTNSPLTLLDAQGVAQPFLAAELPSRDRGTWIVNADGTMATTWRIRDNAVWHDGRPITGRDFAFAFRVYMDPAMEVDNREAETVIDRIEPRDERTFTIHWKATYLKADQMTLRRLLPLPEHALAAAFEQDRAAFQTSTFWSSPSYVGNGPYRLAEWEKGVHHVYHAFDQHFSGRPKIDEVVINIIPDIGTSLANILAGSVDFSGSGSLSAETATTARQNWEGQGEGTVIVSMSILRGTRFQLNPAWTRQPALLDPRVRRAIAFGVDRASIAEVVSGGFSPVGDTFVTPSDALYPRVQEAITKYPFDRSRALALFNEAGWSLRGTTLVNAAGDAFALHVQATDTPSNRLETQTVASDLRAMGIEATSEVYRSGSLDAEQTARFPGLTVGTARTADIPEGLGLYVSNQCPNPDRRWSGDNAGCWSNPEFDRLASVATTRLDVAERTTAIIQALHLLTSEVGGLGTSYVVQFNAVRKGLVGPGPISASQRGYTWNIHEWRWP